MPGFQNQSKLAIICFPQHAKDYLKLLAENIQDLKLHTEH
jgi:hypothetical protein